MKTATFQESRGFPSHTPPGPLPEAALLYQRARSGASDFGGLALRADRFKVEDWRSDHRRDVVVGPLSVTLISAGRESTGPQMWGLRARGEIGTTLNERCVCK
mgnify:CR=1 FL=1